MWKNWKPYALWVGMKNGIATLENNMVVPQKLELPNDPSIPCLGIQQKELKAVP